MPCLAWLSGGVEPHKARTLFSHSVPLNSATQVCACLWLPGEVLGQTRVAGWRQVQ